MKVDYGLRSKNNLDKVVSRATNGKSPDTVSYNFENNISVDVISSNQIDATVKHQLNIEDEMLIFSPNEIDQIENELNGKPSEEKPILTDDEVQWIDRLFMDPIEAIDRDFQYFLDCLREVKQANNQTLNENDIEYAKRFFYQADK